MVNKRFRDLHEFVPRLWRRTHVISGDHEFDASIEHCSNPDAHAKLVRCVAGKSYGPRTNYDGYSGLAGDD